MRDNLWFQKKAEEAIKIENFRNESQHVYYSELHEWKDGDLKKKNFFKDLCKIAYKME